MKITIVKLNTEHFLIAHHCCIKPPYVYTETENNDAGAFY